MRKCALSLAVCAIAPLHQNIRMLKLTKHSGRMPLCVATTQPWATLLLTEDMITGLALALRTTDADSSDGNGIFWRASSSCI
jgi:hypothetical protein